VGSGLAIVVPIKAGNLDSIDALDDVGYRVCLESAVSGFACRWLVEAAKVTALRLRLAHCALDALDHDAPETSMELSWRCRVADDVGRLRCESYQLPSSQNAPFNLPRVALCRTVYEVRVS
jgi:hypothetical protein